MATDRPGNAALGRPKPPEQTQRVIAGPGTATPPTGVTTNITAGIVNREARRSSAFEFRGFDFFANRDFNELKNASRAYFAPAVGSEKQRLPSTWLGDATPPASPRPSGETRAIGGGVGGIGGGGREGRLPSPVGGQMYPGEKKIFGLKRSRFWWLLALVALLLVVAIGVGVGVGVGKGASQKSSQDQDQAQAQAEAASTSSLAPTITASGSSSPAASGTSTSSSTTTTSSTSSTSTPTGNADGKIDCPAANGTTYQVPGSEKRFLRICGIDYYSDEAEDIKQVPTESILDCMKNCAGTTGCTGCGWGYLEGDTGTQHTCWLKGDLKKPHEADVNWAFAVLL
ncbi:hypothetical protein F4804DRAFT_309034 [Jackrogersella minutella]|nr:hypothetical protein F4804DRAFT_309034 [Jackrogersella minutella]